MNRNLTLQFLAIKRIGGCSPLFSFSFQKEIPSISLSDINLKYSTNSFLFGPSSGIRANIVRSTFNKFLKSAIKIVNERYALLDTRTRITFTRKANIFMKDCSFTGCQANGIGVDGHGGAICIFLGPEDLFTLDLERVNFNKCSAKSSGGSIFSFNTLFSANILCFSESFAAKNTIFYVQAKEIKVNCTHAANNRFNDEFNPSSNSIGTSGNLIVFTEVNMSNTFTNSGAALLSAYRFKYFNLNHGLYKNCQGDIGLFMHSVGDLTALSHDCLHTNCTYNDRVLADIDMQITFYHCVFSIGDQRLVSDEDKANIIISGCFLQGSEEEWKERLKGIKFSDMHYTMDANSVTKIALTDVQGSCRNHEKGNEDNDEQNANKSNSKIAYFFKVLIRFAPLLLGFFGGVTLILYISRRRKKSFKTPTALYK